MSLTPKFIEVLKAHRQTKKNSCVPCSVEFILKMFGHLEIDKTPIQDQFDGTPYGYGEVIKELALKGIVAEVFDFTFQELEERSKAEFLKDTPLVFSWPAHIGLDPNCDEKPRVVDLHMHVAFEHNGKMIYPGLGTEGFMASPFDMPTIWSRIQGLCDGYKAQTLVYRQG